MFYGYPYLITLVSVGLCVCLSTDRLSNDYVSSSWPKKAKRSGLPVYLHDLLHDYQPTRTLRSSTANKLQRPPLIGSFADRSFSTAAPTVWNSLLPSTRSADSIGTFKSRLKPICSRQHISPRTIQRYRSAPDYGAIEICIDIDTDINLAFHHYGKLTCHMGSHSVTCHPTGVRIPPLPPAEAGTRFSDPGGMQGWVDLCSVKADRLWIEPATCKSQVQRPIPLSHHATFCIGEIANRSSQFTKFATRLQGTSSLPCVCNNVK